MTAPYLLARDPDGRSVTARENLADILERELLGPAGGPNEILAGPPDSAYLIGRIAPARLTDRGWDEDPATDVGDELDALESRGVPLTAVDDAAATAEEDTVEDGPQRRGLIIPASMGLRLQIPSDLASFTVTASWGTYEALPTEVDDDGKRTAPRFQRTPISIDTVVNVTSLVPKETTAFHLRDTVVLRVDRYDDPERGRRLIEIALCNDAETPGKIPINAWLFQTKLAVTAGGDEVFLPIRDLLIEDDDEFDDELRLLNLQYRDRLEFAVGRTCSVDWDVAQGSRRARSVWTTWLPTCQTPQTRAEEIAAALLDMEQLASAGIDELRAGLEPIVIGYAAWLDGEQTAAEQMPEHLRADALEAVAEARNVHAQLRAGLQHLLDDAEALRCFRFMNTVMASQRIQSQVAERRAQHPAESIAQAREKVKAKGPLAHSWRTFQLAFILMQLPMLTDPAADRRSSELAKAQLLFFPTGGGKTEAYLGLAAYTFAIRRRQGMLETLDGPLDGGGVAVLMRYTLRLLTAQQFQRATAMVCAAEMTRRADAVKWGSEPFRIGLWVGTDVSPKRFEEAEAQLKKVNEGRGHRLTVLQIQRCPWCGDRITARDIHPDPTRQRVFVYCGDELSDCPFAKGGAAEDGLPVLTVDEEIYRLAPAFVIATVDKFARLAREGEAASLFGYVRQRCDLHGYVHTDYAGCVIKDGSKHPGSGATIRPATRLRPPDLIIQDELHLITGALGTTVGLFEAGIDVVSSWRTADGRPVQPLVVASTATARNAADQVKAIYGRDVTIFPPQVLDAGRTYFSKEIPIDDENPGRRYIGISTTGVRLTTAEIRVAEILMAAGQLLLDRSGAAADPYMTLVGYFSATRELAGMKRYLDDDVQDLLAKGRPWSRGLPKRYGTIGQLNITELTARVAGANITQTLDEMAIPFDPDIDSSGAVHTKRRPRQPFDAVLATSMLQVGVDVTRLGLMMVVGQPKNTAEYIQASSRVGRDNNRPGLVVTLGNWARPRDLAHYEQFRHYHETFYAKVEALSVTPYSMTSILRGIDGVLVSAARVLQAGKSGGLSEETGAGRIEAEQKFVDNLIEALVARMGRAARSEDATQSAQERLTMRRDLWLKRRAQVVEQMQTLVYERVGKSSSAPLIISPEHGRALADNRDVPPFVVANSMREVQPEINLLVSPIEANLYYQAPLTAPKWVMPEANEKDAK
ncbi:DISARM system helicase DrmA [Nocardia sp. AG03]|uniref:DISARM system helicase DrmA n=1 Tax=Nocardia sp. AG03 TaxID=3025312 RepID=UPI00241820E5|nr:DISARM system helicase DrmA [Nocardia sp. AG03]